LRVVDFFYFSLFIRSFIIVYYFNYR